MEIPNFENTCEICKEKYVYGALIPNEKEKHFICTNCYENFTTWLLTKGINLQSQLNLYKGGNYE